MDAQIARHYPDLAAAGSLQELLNHELEVSGSSLRMRSLEGLSRDPSPFWAVADEGGRHAQVAIAIELRQFMVEFWRAGVQLATCEDSSPANVARALHAWLVLAADTQALLKTAPLATISPLATAYEAGPQAYVAATWRQLLASIRERQPGLLPLATHAFSTSTLSELLPFTSHDRLCFSRFTGYPFSVDLPCAAALGMDQFRVFGADGTPLGEGDPAHVVDVILRHLPAGCTAAVHGTREPGAA